ncbi:transient receptor potential cation channel subfamily V member 5-like isoform X2 [Tigriopus californicus]|nr:transient receptor potential cation channel subfamily V member 5-like isoform X2 [Tigriopus californicus]
MIKKDYKELDEAIKAKVQPYLYNGGQGKMVPIAQLTMLRNRDRSKSKQLPVIKELGEAAYDFVFEGSELLANVTAGLDPATSPHLFRECCWMAEKRGSVGETVYHICFLMQTPTHLALGRRLLKWYPKLIIDVYLSEEYYGENVLHMSVVAEDPTTVKYLLDQGVDIHERCYGNFMCPEDQKASRSDSLDHEIVDVCTKSNYQGYVAWGEYSLSFAAKLGQEECYRLILSRGGNHDLQDTNGNTVTHIMVVYDNMKMFDLAVECGASINIKNVQNMTPLTVGAYLARQDMFFHIANIEREVYWQIGNVCCSAYPIEQLDTINSETGNLNMRSALNLIVFGDLTEHLDLIEGVVVDLLLTKWKSFIKASFFRQLYAFALYFLLSTSCFIFRPSQPEVVPSMGANMTSPYIGNVNESGILLLDMLGYEQPLSTNHRRVCGHNASTNYFDMVTNASGTLDTRHPTHPTTLDLQDSNEGRTISSTIADQVKAAMPSKTTTIILPPPSTATTIVATTTATQLPIATDLGKEVSGELATATNKARKRRAVSISMSPTAEVTASALSATGVPELSKEEGNQNDFSGALSLFLDCIEPNNGTASWNGTSHLEDKGSILAHNLTGTEDELTPDMCYLHSYSTHETFLRGIGELVLVIWSIGYFLNAMREVSFLGPRLFLKTLALCPSRCLFLCACLLCPLAIPFRLACQPEIEDRLALVVMLFTGPYFLFFCRGFKTTGPFVIMIYRMMAADLLRFVTIYFIFVMGFSQAYYIMFQSYTNTTNPDPMPTPMESIISIFIMSLGSFGSVWEGLGSTNHSFLGKIHSFLFLAIVVVLLVNLLIAMMGDTYTKIAEIKNEWMRQWARTVLIVERGIPPKSRLHHQNLYSERMATGEKALVMKQTMSEEKLAEIQDITEMKVTHRRNIKRRLEKFGYTSNSTIGLDLAGTAANVIAPDADGDDNNPLY